MTSQRLTSGITIADLSERIRPQDDLFHYANEQWMQRTPIPSDKSSYGTFMMLAEGSERAIRAIVEEAQTAPPGTEARKFGDLYSSFLGEARIEERAAAPLRDRLDRVARVSTVAALLGTIGELQRQGTSGFYDLFVDNDPGNPERYLVFVEQGGLSLPDESYYREERFASVRDAFAGHVERMLQLAGLSDPHGRAQRIVELETDLARGHWDNVRCRDSEKTYNLLDWSAASALFDGALPSPTTDDPAPHLQEWLRALGAPPHTLDELVVRQPSFTTVVAGLLGVERLEAWKDWTSWQVIRGDAPYLSSDFVAESFDFYGRTLTGAPQLRERWKRGVAFVEGVMGEAVGKLYVERHFPLAAKVAMDALVTNLVEAYRQSITTLEWMSEATRERALEKLDSFTPKIGFPAVWRDYSSLTVDADDVVANVRAASEFEFQRALAKIGRPLDREEWHMTPQTVNAYYNPGFNEIVFPAAILQSPFFDEARDAAANYGAIGAVIGHEIGHGFDDQGSKFDGSGRLTDWWTPEDRAAFEERTRSLVDQYDALAPRQTPDQRVNGALTIGENIGDLGGLGIAWKAYCLSLEGRDAPVIDGLSGAQRFFLSWALAWQYQAREEEIRRRLAIDPHSPPEFRCNQIVRNIDEYYEAFALSPDDALWLDAADRVTIW